MISSYPANSKYGVAVGLFKGKEVYLSRRMDVLTFSKKWQIVNGYLNDTTKANELSQDAAIRILKDDTGLDIHRNRLHYINLLDFAGERYYLYLVHLNEGEEPKNKPFCTGEPTIHSDWKLFPLDRAMVLDLVPGLRTVMRKLHKCLNKLEEDKKKTTQKIDTSRFSDSESAVWY
jgi:ADP-ribose pyrophosphatase YjhB (NUDIX family)